jgi:hypothetical protein
MQSFDTIAQLLAGAKTIAGNWSMAKKINFYISNALNDN